MYPSADEFASVNIAAAMAEAAAAAGSVLTAKMAGCMRTHAHEKSSPTQGATSSAAGGHERSAFGLVKRW